MLIRQRNEICKYFLKVDSLQHSHQMKVNKENRTPQGHSGAKTHPIPNPSHTYSIPKNKNQVSSWGCPQNPGDRQDPMLRMSHGPAHLKGQRLPKQEAWKLPEIEDGEAPCLAFLLQYSLKIEDLWREESGGDSLGWGGHNITLPHELFAHLAS